MRTGSLAAATEAARTLRFDDARRGLRLAPAMCLALSLSGAATLAVAAPDDSAELGRFEVRREGARSLLSAALDGALSSEDVVMETLTEPNRLVIDIANATVEPRYQRVRMGAHGTRRARVARKDDGVRIVLDLAPGEGFPEVAVDAVEGRLELAVSSVPRPVPAVAAREEVAPVESADAEAPAELADAEAAPEAVEVAEVPPEALDEVAPVPAATPAPAEVVSTEPAPTVEATHAARTESQPLLQVENVRFEPKDGFYRLTVDFESELGAQSAARAGTESSPELRLANVRLPAALERTMDVSAVAGEALTSVSTYVERGTLVVAARILDATEHRHWAKGRRLMWDFRSSEPRLVEYDNEGTAAYTTDAARAAGSIVPQRQRYTGRRISLDLKDADILNVLRLLADVSKLNIVAGDDVKGQITIKLRNVPWDQALDIILRTKQLDKTRNGNIIRVAPLEVLQKEEDLRLKRLEAQVKLEPLTVRIIPVSYAVAADVMVQVLPLLTDRGTVTVDPRTNVLIVEDVADVLTKAERLVRTLDTQTPQVLIEARIVEARSNFSRQLGIQWGGNATYNSSFGNQTGLSFPSSIGITGGADDSQNQVTEGVVSNPNYAVNLPATVGSGGGGALGFVFGSLSGNALLSLRLSAAEATGKIKIVSAPKVVTLDNVEAEILSGERVPITVITANGPTTRFINANIELKVRPHVTQDGSIMLAVEAKKNELSDRVDLLGVPGILTKEARTTMIVRDGDTAVLGGLYRRNTSENESYVPWIGKIPVLGWLFKTTTRSDARDELLIFISPRIVNRSSALVAPE